MSGSYSGHSESLSLTHPRSFIVEYTLGSALMSRSAFSVVFSCLQKKHLEALQVSGRDSTPAFFFFLRQGVVRPSQFLHALLETLSQGKTKIGLFTTAYNEVTQAAWRGVWSQRCSQVCRLCSEAYSSLGEVEQVWKAGFHTAGIRPSPPSCSPAFYTWHH